MDFFFFLIQCFGEITSNSATLKMVSHRIFTLRSWTPGRRQDGNPLFKSFEAFWLTAEHKPLLISCMSPSATVLQPHNLTVSFELCREVRPPQTRPIITPRYKKKKCSFVCKSQICAEYLTGSNKGRPLYSAQRCWKTNPRNSFKEAELQEIHWMRGKGITPGRFSHRGSIPQRTSLNKRMMNITTGGVKGNEKLLWTTVAVESF